MAIKQNISFYIRMRVSSKKAKKGSIILQITIDSQVDRIPLDISWPVEFFDTDKGELLPRFENDELCVQNNFKIKNEKALAEKLEFRLYALEKTITHALFRKELRRRSSKDDVIENFRFEAGELFDSGIAKPRTFKNYNTVFNRMDIYFAEKKIRWQFNTFNLTDLKKLEVWIREKHSHNTVAGMMRVLHKFSTLAVNEYLIEEDPFKDYKIPGFVDGARDRLEIHELKQFLQFFKEGKGMTDFEHDVARRFLISCYTGLRKSDIEQLQPRYHIRNTNILRLSMFKTRKEGKVVEFNLPKVAVQLIGNKRDLLFPEIESATLCKTLRRVLAKAGIYKYLKFHSGRDTFATIYLELGGNPVDLQEILGHADLKTTMIYVKMTSRTKNLIMDQFDALV